MKSLADGWKEIAAREKNTCRVPWWIEQIDAMFTELRADLVHAPSRAKISDVGYIQSQMGTFPRMADHVANLKAKTSDVEVTEEMVQAGVNAYWAEMKPNVGPGLSLGLRVAYRAMRALEPIEPKQPVEITDEMIRLALRSYYTNFPLGDRDRMRAAIQAALTPNEEETR